MNMVNTTYNSTDYKIGKRQVLKGKRKLKFYKIVSKHYDMNIGMDEDPFARHARGITKIYREVINLMKILQTRPQVKNMNNNYMIFILLLLEIEMTKTL